MRIGAHVRRRTGGIGGAVEEAKRRDADCAQVFLSNPRGWAPPHVGDEDAAAFRTTWQASGLAPLVVHAPYVLNIASANPDFLARSRELGRSLLRTCDAVGADMLVVHAGTGGTDPHDRILSRAAESLRVIADAAVSARLVVELEEGVPAASSSTAGEIAELFDSAGVPDVGVCVDTCHAFATGYALETAEGVAALADELRDTGVLSRLALIHANDSRFERGAHRDRHADIGDGAIGLDGWRAIVGQPELTAVPFILETPGDPERQARDIALLRSMGRT